MACSAWGRFGHVAFTWMSLNLAIHALSTAETIEPFPFKPFTMSLYL